MKRYALHEYICPISGEPLELVAIKLRPLDLDAEQVAQAHRLGIDPAEASIAIEEGILYSEKGGYWFPIINFVPILLDFPVDLHTDFVQRHGAAYDILTRLSMPNGAPRLGEMFVQRSFTREWAIMDLDVISFGLSPEQRDFFITLELDWPPGIRDRENLRVLEVGCGSGFESASLFRVTKGAIFGFDLNLALLQKGHLLAGNPFINNAVCSLFRLPLREMSFDIVYSSGVIHHTFSTVEALKQILRFKKSDGLLYVWVYASESSDYSLRSRFGWLAEDIFRPRIARLPEFWQNLLVKALAWRHYREYKAVGGYNKDKWRRKDSEHFVRDRWTCLYAHRQSFNAMMVLFSELGMDYKFIDPRRYYEFMKVPLIGIGIRGVHPNGTADEWHHTIPHQGMEGIATAEAVNARHWPGPRIARVWHRPRFVLRGALLMTLAADPLGREALLHGTKSGLKRPLLLELGRVVAAKRRLARFHAHLAPRLSDNTLELHATVNRAELLGGDDLSGALSSGEVEACELTVDPQIAHEHFLLYACRYELPALLGWFKEKPERLDLLIAPGMPQIALSH